jgi:hypothetical protein
MPTFMPQKRVVFLRIKAIYQSAANALFGPKCVVVEKFGPLSWSSSEFKLLFMYPREEILKRLKYCIWLPEGQVIDAKISFRISLGQLFKFLHQGVINKCAH